MHVAPHLASANALLEQGCYAEAQQALTEAAVQHPLCAETRHCLGQLFLQRGEWEVAAHWLDAALQRSPGRRDTRFQLAWSLWKLHRPQAGLDLLATLESTPTISHLRARLLLDLGRANDALVALSGCELPAADLERGWACWLVGQMDPAKHAWSRWLRAGAADWGTKDALAICLFLLGGGPRVPLCPERPREPIQHLARWFRWLCQHGYDGELEQLIDRGRTLPLPLWRGLQKEWLATAQAEKKPALVDRLRTDVEC
ncbi:MAG: tetratricopeptide repeat protein [Candidatus Sericytochromatia bacterium]|nr:tetratricopeptide repeat protein [Candidatus Sericytochromatia bacterium]